MRQILEEKSAKYVENRSKFFSYVFFCNSLDDQDAILKKIKSMHPSSTHVCYASIFDDGEIRSYSSDDREPSGTAGMQILLALKKNELINAICIVVRYFGGVKLGATNLSQAYRQSAQMSLVDNFVEVTKKYKYHCICSYEEFSQIKSRLDKYRINMFDEQFDNNVSFSIYLSCDEVNLISDLCQKNKLNEFKYL